jgi:hypothetical protein
MLRGLLGGGRGVWGSLGMMIGLVVVCRVRVVEGEVGEVDVVLDVDLDVEVEVGVGVGRALVGRWRSEAMEVVDARWAGLQIMLVTGLD